MTIRIILALAFGVGIGFPLGVAVTFRTIQGMVRRSQALTVAIGVTLDEYGIPESVALDLPEEADRRIKRG